MINQEKSLIKTILPHIGAILFLFIITLVYFSPVLDGKSLPQTDVHQFDGMAHETLEYYQKEGVSSIWTNSMFSGMPTYQIGIWGSNSNFVDYLEKPLKMLGNINIGPVFTGMLIAYLIFVLMGFGILPSLLGAIAYSLSSYNIIIIEAGHITKAWAIAYLPMVVAGVLVMFRKKYLLGGILMALGLCLQIKSNHLQVTYYTGILCLIIYIGFLISTILEKDFKALLKASGVLAIAVILAVLPNLSNFYGNYEMAQESIRGKSELSQPTESEKQSSGLNKDYTFAWSYGKAETFSLLIPNIHGGASGSTLDASSNIYKQLKANGAQVPLDGVPQMPTYWGDQPFTSGPVYLGAIVCFLFILGMVIIRSKLKWVLCVATVFFIFLAWGRNFETFNDFFFYHFPFYNKFRAVSTALVIPAFTMVVVAVWALKEFFEGEIDSKKLKALYWSGGITAGLCLFFWLLPDFFFNFTTDSDAQWKTQYPDWFHTAILQDRKDLLSADALRSFIFIVLSVAVLWGASKVKTNKQTLTTVCTLAIAVFILCDLWSVDKRYLGNDKFKSKSLYQAQKFQKSKADEFILQDQSPSYRVLNLNNPFNESNTSYYHKSIGGYHAAKLRRYQEMIESRLEKEISQIIASFQTQNIDSITASFENLTALNMLNAKYIIFDPSQPPLVNPYRLGNAWFVSEYSFANTADDEINALNSINPAKTAVIDKKFEQELAGLNIAPDSTATINLTVSKPDRVSYKTKSQSEQLAVFSEVYYANGWEAFVDGKPVPHVRADWTLRAMRIPAGEHDVEFKFVPEGYYIARKISMASSALLILLLLGGIVFSIKNKLRSNEE